MQPRLEIPISTCRINPDSVVRGPNSSPRVLVSSYHPGAKNSNEKEVNTAVKQDHKQDKELNIQFKLGSYPEASLKKSSWVAWLWSQLCPPGSQERLHMMVTRRPLSSWNMFLHRIFCGHHPPNGRKFLQASLGRTMQGIYLNTLLPIPPPSFLRVQDVRANTHRNWRPPGPSGGVTCTEPQFLHS